jgi:hypothetical protein
VNGFVQQRKRSSLDDSRRAGEEQELEALQNILLFR